VHVVVGDQEAAPESLSCHQPTGTVMGLNLVLPELL
jgi:hypothetical protein